MPIFSSSVRPKCDLTVTGYKQFSVQISQDRLSRIQSIVREDETLLIVCGIDSHFNQGSQQLFDYLLFNVAQKRATEIQRTKLEDEHFDDAVLSIRRDRVQVYLNPANYWFYLPYVACWPNVDIHCAPDATFDDQDAMEELKMKFLIQAVADCKSACVAYYGKDHTEESSAFSPMLVEKWPLIQAYAVDGFGVGTFFTLKHQLRDVSKAVAAALQSVDSVVVEELLDKPIKPFKHQFDSAFQTMDLLTGRSDAKVFREQKTLDQLIEPFKSYAVHELSGGGAVKHRKASVSSLSSYLTFDTRKSTIGEVAKKAAELHAVVLQPFAPLPSSFIIHSEDRLHSLLCTRTGFLHWSKGADNERIKSESDVFNQDLNYVYSKMVQIVRKKMRSINADYEFESLAAELRSELSQQLGIPEGLIQVSSERLKPAEVIDKPGQHLRFVSCSVSDLTPESLNEAQWSGSVTIADTYFVTDSNGSQCLTGVIPAACHWTCDSVSSAAQRILASTAQQGDSAEEAVAKSRLAELTVSIGSDAAAAGVEMTAVCLTGGRLLLHSQRECIQKLLQPLRARILPGGDSLDQPCRLAFDLPDTAAVPDTHEHLLNSRRQLRLLLTAASRSKRDFFAKVASVWRSEGVLTAQQETEDESADESASAVSKKDNADDESLVEVARTGAILIWGHLGSYAENLAQELTDSNRTLIDLLQCDSTADAAKRLKSMWMPEKQAVILCPSLVTPETLLRAAAAPLPVASVVVCVNSHTAVVSGRCRMQPGLLNSLAEAACSVVVLTAPAEDGALVESAEDPAVSEVSRLLRLVNAQSARVIRAPQGRLTTAGAAALVPPEVPLWRSLTLKRSQQRRSEVLNRELDLRSLGLNRVSVTFSRPLERERLVERLKTLSAGPKSRRPRADELLETKFFYISGMVPVKQPSSGQQWLHFWRHCASDSSCSVAPAKNQAMSTACVVAFGRGLETDDLRRLMRLCAPLKPTRRALMIRSDLTPAAVARIHKERHLDPLPEGWFFNGTKYISFDGESSKTHPSLEAFLESYIAQENKKIADFNAKLAGVTDWRDIFDD